MMQNQVLVVVNRSHELAQGATSPSRNKVNRKRLASAVSTCSNLQQVVQSSLSLERMDLWGEYENVDDDDLIRYVLPAIPKSSWTTLDLRRSPLSLRGVRALAQALVNTPASIKKLCLGGIALGDKGLISLAAFLPSLKIESLSLFDNGITDLGITAFCCLLPSTKLKELDLSNNIITDDGALEISRVMRKTSLQRLVLNTNSLTSFGADTLVDSIKHSNLNYLGLRNNEEVLNYSRIYLNWVTGVLRSERFRICMTLSSPKCVPSIGKYSSLKTLPLELIRRVVEALYTPDMWIDETDFEAADVEDEEEERAEVEEDLVAALTHHKRLCF